MKIITKKRDSLHFGEVVAGYDIPVLNEREIRAAAGILFLVMFIALMLILLKQDFLLIKYVISAFFIDFIIRVLINPTFSPTLILGRIIVSKQVPEYVGAPQKKFAWTIGLVLSGLMFLLLVVLNSYSIITSITCFLCLCFLFFETAFGICVGCLFYRLFYKNAVELCTGEMCKQNEKHAIQKNSWVQLLTLFSYVLLIVLAVVFFSQNFRDPPKNLWQIINVRKLTLPQNSTTYHITESKHKEREHFMSSTANYTVQKFQSPFC
jgi:hypothetical protein